MHDQVHRETFYVPDGKGNLTTDIVAALEKTREQDLFKFVEKNLGEMVTRMYRIHVLDTYNRHRDTSDLNALAEEYHQAKSNLEKSRQDYAPLLEGLASGVATAQHINEVSQLDSMVVNNLFNDEITVTILKSLITARATRKDADPQQYLQDEE